MVGELFHRDESEGASVGVAAGAMEASGMKIKIWRYDLALTHTWTIASSLASGGKNFYATVFVELTNDGGLTGVGESAPSSRVDENAYSVESFLRKVDPQGLDLLQKRFHGIGVLIVAQRRRAFANSGQS